MYLKKYNLKGKYSLVTGAGKGLGRACAIALAEAGSNLILISRTKKDLDSVSKIAKKHRVKCKTYVCDLTNYLQLKQVINSQQKIDVLINNAALYGALKSSRFEDIDEDQWDKAMNVNVKGVWNCIRAVIPSMREQKSGSIINIASLAALYGMPYAADYATSKAAVLGLTRVVAREVGKDNIRVNSVAPSMVYTESAKEFLGEKAERGFEVISKSQILQKTLEVDDIYGTVLYLASDQSKFVTGQTLMVDGGSVLL